MARYHERIMIHGNEKSLQYPSNWCLHEFVQIKLRLKKFLTDWWVMSKTVNVCKFLFLMFLNHLITSDEFCHWFTFNTLLIFVLTCCKICLLILPNSFFCGIKQSVLWIYSKIIFMIFNSYKTLTFCCYTHFEQDFNATAPFHSNILHKCGYSEKLTFEKEHYTHQRINRERNIIWYNPSFSKNVKINIAKRFLHLSLYNLYTL